MQTWLIFKDGSSDLTLIDVHPLAVMIVSEINRSLFMVSLFNIRLGLAINYNVIVNA